MTFNIRPLASLALVATLCFSSLVIAHPGGMGRGQGMGPMGGMSGPRAMMMADPAAMAEQHLAGAKIELKITADQETAWQTFAGKAKQQAASMQGMRGQMQPMQGSAPDRMSQRAEMMKSRSEQMATMSTALRDLYAVLSPEQKLLADKQFPMMQGNRMSFAR